MEKLIETRDQYNAIRSKVLANVWTIENVRNLLGRSCIKEEYEKYKEHCMHSKKYLHSANVKKKRISIVFLTTDLDSKMKR